MDKLALWLGMCSSFSGFDNSILWATADLPQRMAVTQVKGTVLPLPPTVNNSTYHFLSPELSNIDFISKTLIKQKNIQVIEQGPPGSLSNVLIRGSKSVHNAVVIDGVQMNSCSDGGGYDFSQVLVDDYSDITVASNPSYLNQSQATGGAILLTTKQGQGKPTATTTLEGSTYPARKLNVQTQGSHQKNDLYLSITDFQSGRGSRSSLHHNVIADKYHLQTLTTNLGLSLNPKLSVRSITHWQSSTLKLNTYRGALPYCTDNYQKTEKYDTSLDLNYKLNTHIKHQLLLTNAQKRLSFSDSLTPKIINQQNILMYQFDWQAAANTAVKIGLENRWEYYKSARQITMNDSPKFLNIGLEDQFNTRCQYQIRTRYHRLYNSKNYITYQLSSQYHINNTIQLKAGYGTGLRSPNMAERYGNPPYQLANQQLSPEKSHNYDVGIQSQHFHKKLLLDVNIFHNFIDNFITFTAVQPNVYKNYNSQKRTTQGLELFVQWMYDQKTKLEFNYSYITAFDSQIQSYPLRLARHKFSNDVVITPATNWDFYAGIFYKSAQTDKIFSNNSDVRLKGYAIFHAGFVHKIDNHLELTGRIDNLFNHRYENVYGFGANGREIFISLRAKL